MKEYKIITASPETCQKWLNQWKHEYEIEILHMISREISCPDKTVDEILASGSMDNNFYVELVILLTREKK